MDFAKDLLGKYGWREGSGLGKNSDGITKPVKAKYKFDTSGFGHNKADEINKRWWEDAYRPTNLPAKKDSNDELPNNDDIEAPTNSKYKGLFLKTSTLVNSVEKNEKPTKNVIETTPTDIIIPTDAELYKACGGRTAHKGARHGLTLKGKLARIEAQEQELLKKMKETYAPRWIEDKLVTKKKEKEKILKEEFDDKTYENIRDPETENLNKILNLDDYQPRSSREIKKRKKIDDELSEALANFSTDENEQKLKHKIKKIKNNDQSTSTSSKTHKRQKKPSTKESSGSSSSSVPIIKIEKLKIKSETKEYKTIIRPLKLQTNIHDGAKMKVDDIEIVAKLFKQKRNKIKIKANYDDCMEIKEKDNILKLEKTITKEKKIKKPHKSKRDSNVNKLVTNLETNMVIK